MLFITCTWNIDAEAKEHLRKEIKEKTGEDCIFMPDFFRDVQLIRVKKEQPLWMRLFQRIKG